MAETRGSTDDEQNVVEQLLIVHRSCWAVVALQLSWTVAVTRKPLLRRRRRGDVRDDTGKSKLVVGPAQAMQREDEVRG